MKVAKNLRVGDIIQFPKYEYAPLRKGWNGWIFSAGIVEKLYQSNGEECAVVRYCVRTAGRYQLLPNVEATKNLKCKYLFEYDFEFHANRTREFLEIEKSGSPVCWDQDSALFVNHGLI